MIDWLEIKQFSIAEHIELEFDNNFTTLTGETGSGKSLIVDAIDILLGHRSDSSYIRHNRDTAEIQAGFAVPDGHNAVNWLREHEMYVEGECVLRRVLRRNKPSRGYINGHAATASQLKNIGRELVDIHGQNQHHSLLRTQTQLKLLDCAAGNLEKITILGNSYDVLVNTEKQIRRLRDESRGNREKADLLEFQIKELKELDPQPGEWSGLESAHKRFSHQHELITGAKAVADGIHESESRSLSRALLDFGQQLSQLSEYAEELKPIENMLDEARINLEEAAVHLRPFYRDVNVDPEEMEAVETRISRYHSLARKHRIQADSLQDHLQAMEQKLDGLKDPESEIERLQSLYLSEHEKYKAAAEEISSARRKTAKRLVREVTDIMQTLGMEGGKIDIHFSDTDENEITRYGNESAEFLVTANAGHPLLPLNKVASGGELSRISLAIQVVLADEARVPTLIFDEVDVGIGGEVASTVGQKLKELGESSQVICITHLSQVAAKGDHHFNVTKHNENEVETRVTKLNHQQRIREIARMSSGEKITEQSLAHAQEMLKYA